MRSVVRVSEGKKRLRLLVSILIATATYIYLFTNERRVDVTEALVAFPIVSMLIFGVVYALLTAVYWVIDGFEKDNVKIYRARNITGLELFEIADGASVEFQSKLVVMAKIDKTGIDEIDNINRVIIESWQQPALAYSFALTCICMLKHQKTFFQTNTAKDFSEAVSEKLRYLSDKELSMHTDKSLDPVKSKEISDSVVKKMIIGVLFFSENMLKITKRVEPLQLLNEYVVEKTSLKQPSHYKEVTDAGKALLRKIDKALA